MPEEFGPYLVYEQIGLGGMATVHRAETLGVAGFRKAVALKRMLPSVASDATLVQSFIREARLASHLRHANVAQTYDLGKVGDTYFIAMELVPGRNVREILRQCVTTTGPMPLPIALNILSQICDALDYAHDLCDETGQRLGIIHRDVSPSNIIVSEGGVVKLIDFGIAKATGGGMQTMSGTIKGKFGYMAPEYISGRIDARIDLFAAGVIGYELLTNKPLFTGTDDMDTLMKVKTMPIPPPSRTRPEIPPEIDAIVMTALERDPNRRWQRANALRTALATEIKRLGLVALGPQVYDWVDWAFAQRREDSEPIISISPGTVPPIAAGSAPGSQGAAAVTSALAQDSMPTLIRPSGPRVALGTVSPMTTQLGMGAPPPSSVLPPSLAALSGARSVPFVAQSVTDVRVRDSAILHVESVPTVVAEASRKPGHALGFALLVLAIAAATATAVYFALPSFT